MLMEKHDIVPSSVLCYTGGDEAHPTKFASLCVHVRLPTIAMPLTCNLQQTVSLCTRNLSLQYTSHLYSHRHQPPPPAQAHNEVSYIYKKINAI